MKTFIHVFNGLILTQLFGSQIACAITIEKKGVY